MLPNLGKIVETAIRNKRRLLIHYNGVNRTRVIEPHILFRTEDRKSGLVAYQVSGYSSRDREPPFWRPFQLGKVDSVVVLEEVFSPRVEKGFHKVRSAVKGEEVMVVDASPSEYYYLEPRVYGPPVPDHIQLATNLSTTVDRSVSR
ncbi:MAG: hypothetical protein OEU36_02960 [Gammaproteobacteria bacterium]|nr:hypothetical protein [Gammaproteobacteria bacterium]